MSGDSIVREAGGDDQSSIQRGSCLCSVGTLPFALPACLLPTEEVSVRNRRLASSFFLFLEYCTPLQRDAVLDNLAVLVPLGGIVVLFAGYAYKHGAVHACVFAFVFLPGNCCLPTDEVLSWFTLNGVDTNPTLHQVDVSHRGALALERPLHQYPCWPILRSRLEDVAVRVAMVTGDRFSPFVTSPEAMEDAWRVVETHAWLQS